MSPKKTKKILMTGNEAFAEAAIGAGCRFYAGYPITPQNEVPAYFAKRMPQVNGVFIQAESEIAAINMVFGASAAGRRAMTSSSSPGISLKQEGISYLAGCRLPAVIVNVMRGGPGLGNISPSQADYFQAVKGGGHGDYHSIVLAPSNVQEAYELTILAFDLADRYRLPVIVLADGMLGQTMEAMDLNSRPRKLEPIKKKWALTGAKNRKPNIVRSLFLKEGALEELNRKLQQTYKKICKKEVRFESNFLDDSKLIIVSYGSMGRICASVVNNLQKQGLKIGLFRPVTLWPYPKKEIAKIARGRKILVIEMSSGQMLEDVKLSVNGVNEVSFLGKCGGGMPSEAEIITKVKSLL